MPTFSRCVHTRLLLSDILKGKIRTQKLKDEESTQYYLNITNSKNFSDKDMRSSKMLLDFNRV